MNMTNRGFEKVIYVLDVVCFVNHRKDVFEVIVTQVNKSPQSSIVRH